MKVITVSGRAEAGKDFFAKILKEKLEKKGKKVLIVHYADYLKFIAKEYFGWDGVKDEKGRTLLQELGTNRIRERIPDFWVTIVFLLMVALEKDFDYFIIPDCRFPNEIEFIKDKIMVKSNFITVKVYRLHHENSLTPEQRSHPSETALDDYYFDYHLYAQSGEEDMSYEVETFIRKMI